MYFFVRLHLFALKLAGAGTKFHKCAGLSPLEALAQHDAVLCMLSLYHSLAPSRWGARWCVCSAGVTAPTPYPQCRARNRARCHCSHTAASPGPRLQPPPNMTNPHQLQLKRHAKELKRKHALQATALPPSAPTVHARLTEAPTQHKQP